MPRSVGIARGPYVPNLNLLILSVLGLQAHTGQTDRPVDDKQTDGHIRSAMRNAAILSGQHNNDEMIAYLSV